MMETLPPEAKDVCYPRINSFIPVFSIANRPDVLADEFPSIFSTPALRGYRSSSRNAKQRGKDCLIDRSPRIRGTNSVTASFEAAFPVD